MKLSTSSSAEPLYWWPWLSRQGRGLPAENQKCFICAAAKPTRRPMEEDAELKLITQRKLARMKRMAATTTTTTTSAKPQKAEKTDRRVVAEVLVDRGDEVLEA